MKGHEEAYAEVLGKENLAGIQEILGYSPEGALIGSAPEAAVEVESSPDNDEDEACGQKVATGVSRKRKAP